MDKIMIATGFLFFAADVFALTSVFNPVWVVSHGSGAMTMGPISQCLTIFGRDTVCIPPNLCPAWQITLLFILCAIICQLLLFSKPIMFSPNRSYMYMTMGIISQCLTIFGRDMLRAMTMGLISQCLTIFGRDTVCIPPNLCPAWQITLLFIVCAIICLTITCVMFAYSTRRVTMLDHARWFSFAAIILLCLAAIIFPIGFYIDEIGGEPYKLPSTVSVGSSYVIFLISIVLTVISELLAGKLCAPLFVVRG